LSPLEIKLNPVAKHQHCLDAIPQLLGGDDSTNNDVVAVFGDILLQFLVQFLRLSNYRRKRLPPRFVFSWRFFLFP